MNTIKRLLLSLFIVLPLVNKAQNVGLSFSYFIPKHGYFSTPISPFSIRGLGVNLNRYVALETGASLYRMSGLNLKNLPFESKSPIVGPNFTIFVPVELVLQFNSKRTELDIKGGGFVFYGLGQKVNYGSLDRALRNYQNWDIANADVSFKNNPGFGYHFGMEFTVKINRQLGISIESNYLIGGANFPLKGTVSGGMLNGTNQIQPIDFSNSKIDFTGYEFSIGVIFSGR